MAEEMLVISTLRTRMKIEIDGTHFELLGLQEMRLSDRASLQILQKALQSEFEAKEQDPYKLEGISKKLREFIPRILLNVPSAVVEILTDENLLAIVTAFCTAGVKPGTTASESPAEAKS